MGDTDQTHSFSSASEIAADVREETVAPTDAVDASLDRIEAMNGELNAFVTVTDDLARETAREADRAVESGSADDLGPLHGVPVALKDLGDLKEGVKNTFGCVAFADFVAPRTAVAVERLEAAGAVVVGKTNVSELGHAGVTDNELVGPTANPFDTDRNAGGSSGGSAAAVAAGMVPVAMGSDAGGSIRIPAALCGVYGVKPSFGLVPVDSRPNAFGKKLHHVVKGPLTRTVEDAALLLDVLAGPHPSDPASVPVEMDFRGALDRDVSGMRVAYSPDLDAFEVDDAVASVVESGLDAFEAAGATVETVTVDHGLSNDELADGIMTTFAVSVAGAVETIREFEGVDLRSDDVPVSETLTYLLEEAEDREATDVALTGVPRTQFYDAVQDVFAAYDLLVTPTAGTTAPPLSPAVDAYQEWALGRVLTWPFNWTGHPAASVPAGLTPDGLPVGMQVVAPQYADDRVIAASAAIERERPWHDHYG